MPRLAPKKPRKHSSRQKRKSSLGEKLVGIHQRASKRANLKSKRRRSEMTRKAAIAGTSSYHDIEEPPLSLLRAIIHWALAMMLAPLCLITMMTLVQHGNEERILSGIWSSTKFICFLFGVCSMTSFFVTGIGNSKLLYLYVLGHEMTHAMFVYLCGGRISDIHVSSSGGYIMTNKSNILIALSPYFIPFWAAVLISVYSLASLFGPIPAGDLILLSLLGFTWTFHLIWTLWMIPKDQPDLKEHGTFFSLMVIILANLGVISLMLCATSKEIKLSAFIFNWWNNFLDLIDAGKGFLAF